MLYEFFDAEANEVVHLDYPMGEAPAVFDQIDHEGRPLVRMASNVRVDVQRDLSKNPGGALKSQSLPLNWPWAKQHDAQGRAVFKDHREAQECVKKAKDDGEYIQGYDSKWGKN